MGGRKQYHPESLQNRFTLLNKCVFVSVGSLIFNASVLLCIFGDVMKIDTTGASEQTARQDKLTVKGMPA